MLAIAAMKVSTSFLLMFIFYSPPFLWFYYTIKYSTCNSDSQETLLKTYSGFKVLYRLNKAVTRRFHQKLA